MRNVSVLFIIILFCRKAVNCSAVSTIPKKKGNIVSLSLSLGRERGVWPKLEQAAKLLSLLMNAHTAELLLSAVKSMAIEMPSRKKLTLLYLSDNNVGCQIQ